MKKCFILLAITSLFVSCGNNSNSNKKDDFFEGIFTPGILVAKYKENLGSRCTVEQELTIHEKDYIELREKRTYSYDGNVEIKTYSGYVTGKYSEYYNGVHHTWFTIKGKSVNLVTEQSIDTEGNAVPGKGTTYQELYACMNDSRQGFYWKMNKL